MRSYRRSTRTMRAAPRVARRSNIRQQAFGNFASAMQQRDSTNVVVSTQEDVSIVVPVNCNQATLVRNCNAILTGCQYFENYMGMYDQYKVNAIRVSAEMTYISPTLLNSATFPSICTSWDRNGIKIDSVTTTDGTAAQRYALPNYDVVASYSSANEKTLYYGSRWGVVRQLDAASLMEKSMYLSTTNTRDVLSNGNLYSAWNPMLLIGIKSPTVLTTGQTGYCTISLHWQYDVTLRGLRKVATAGSMDKYKPNPWFVGYAPNNYGFAVLKYGATDQAAANWVVVGSIQGAVPVVPGTDPRIPNLPTINPDYDMPVGGGNGLIIPNDGTATNNVGL